MSDNEAFEKWHRDNQVFPNDGETAIGYANRYGKEAWMAALSWERKRRSPLDALSLYDKLEQERERSKKLVEALEKIPKTSTKRCRVAIVNECLAKIKG